MCTMVENLHILTAIKQEINEESENYGTIIFENYKVKENIQKSFIKQEPGEYFEVVQLDSQDDTEVYTKTISLDKVEGNNDSNYGGYEMRMKIKEESDSDTEIITESTDIYRDSKIVIEEFDISAVKLETGTKSIEKSTNFHNKNENIVQNHKTLENNSSSNQMATNFHLNQESCSKYNQKTPNHHPDRKKFGQKSPNFNQIYKNSQNCDKNSSKFNPNSRNDANSSENSIKNGQNFRDWYSNNEKYLKSNENSTKFIKTEPEEHFTLNFPELDRINLFKIIIHDHSYSNTSKSPQKNDCEASLSQEDDFNVKSELKMKNFEEKDKNLLELSKNYDNSLKMDKSYGIKQKTVNIGGNLNENSDKTFKRSDLGEKKSEIYGKFGQNIQKNAGIQCRDKKLWKLSKLSRKFQTKTPNFTRISSKSSTIMNENGQNTESDEDNSSSGESMREISDDDFLYQNSTNEDESSTELSNEEVSDEFYDQNLSNDEISSISDPMEEDEDGIQYKEVDLNDFRSKRLKNLDKIKKHNFLSESDELGSKIHKYRLKSEITANVDPKIDRFKSKIKKPNVTTKLTNFESEFRGEVQKNQLKSDTFELKSVKIQNKLGKTMQESIKTWNLGSKQANIRNKKEKKNNSEFLMNFNQSLNRDHSNYTKSSTNSLQILNNYLEMSKNCQESSNLSSKQNLTSNPTENTIEIQDSSDSDGSNEEISISSNDYSTIQKSNPPKYHPDRTQIHPTISKTPKQNLDPQISLKCSECPMIFQDTLRLNRHKRLHIAPQFQCRNCLRKFKRKNMLKTHLCDIKCPNCPDICTCRMETSKDCIICQKINYRYFVDYKQHMLVQHNEIVTCKICERNNFTFFKHKQLQHSVSKYYRCSECTSILKSREQLDYHMENHQKNFTCNQCGKNFSRRYILRQHEKIHENPSYFHCDICDKNFLRKFCLDKHVKMIHGDKVKEEKYLKRNREMRGEPSIGWVRCSKCPALFRNQKSHQRHLDQAH